MTETDIQELRKGFGFERQRQAFDAFLLGMEALQLSGPDRVGYVKEARDAVRRIVWPACETVRISFLHQAGMLLEDLGLDIDTRKALQQKMYIRFMEGRIRFYEFQERLEQYPDDPVPVGLADFHNTEMAAVFAHLPAQPETEKWLWDLGVYWGNTQLHMVNWFAGQLSIGSGKYGRIRPNHSARVTYQRLQDPFALLWIAASLGEKEEAVRRAAQMAEQRETREEKCIVIRNMIPFSRIYRLALPTVLKERENGRSGCKPQAS